MTRLDPGLLRACAAYLAYADVYALNHSEVLAMLRKSARAVSAHRAVYGNADELTIAHLHAIRYHGAVTRVGNVGVSKAILDATPSMLAWWCERLSEGKASS